MMPTITFQAVHRGKQYLYIYTNDRTRQSLIKITKWVSGLLGEGEGEGVGVNQKLGK